MPDFKWTLTRPGISLEFETGSVKEAIGLLEAEGTSISEVFGFALPAAREAGEAAAEIIKEEQATKPRGRPRKPAPEATAPDPLPVPVQEVAPPLVPTALPPVSPIDTTPNANGIPAFLDRTQQVAPPPIPAAAPPPPSLPPVGVLGPKLVAALDAHKAKGNDGGQALADWLAAAGLTIKGKSYDDATRALLMISDEKITASGVCAAFGIS